MTFIIIYGVKITPICVDDFLIKCPSCETHSWAEILIISKYIHIFFIPFFPKEKEANVVCKKCGLRRYNMTVSSKLIENIADYKKKFRHPWFTFTGSAIIVALILWAVFSII
jgi:hypothetical protein